MGTCHLFYHRARQHLTRHVFSLIFSIRCVFAFPGMASCIHCSLFSIYSLSGLFRIRLQLLRMQRRQRFIREATITHYRNAFGRSCKYPYDAPMEKADHTIYGITVQYLFSPFFWIWQPFAGAIVVDLGLEPRTRGL